MEQSKESLVSYSVNAELQDSTKIENSNRSDSPRKRKSNWSKASFRLAVTLLEIVGIACICLVAEWTAKYMDADGFAWRSDPNKQFKYHPLLMVLGLVFLYGNAIIIYRMFSESQKFTLKIIHAVLHGSAFVLSVVALVAVFDFHSYKNYRDLYSLHSWIGITTVALFALQYVVGFCVYLIPRVPQTFRSNLMPFHVFFGLLLFIAAIVACLTGMMEKLLRTPKYSNLETAGLLGNSLGISLIVFAALVVFVAISNRYKRLPLPSEMHVERTYSPQQEQQSKS